MRAPLPPAQDETMLYVRLDGREWSFPTERTIDVGRDPDADIHLDDRRVSREHVRLWYSDSAWWIADQASRNGTWLVGRDRAIDRPVRVVPGGLRLRLGGVDGPELVLSAEPPLLSTEEQVLTIGRSRSCDIVVDDPLVSSHHAAVETGEHAVLHDTGSFNGTFLNGKPVHGDTRLRPGDIIGLGSSTLIWDGVRLVSRPQPRAVFSTKRLQVTGKSGAHLMDDVSITVPAGSLVAVIGPSRAGADALLAALAGRHPPTQGHVTWNGRDLHAEYAQLHFLVGLVPREDVLQGQLTVGRALQLAADLRLPPDTSGVERDQRVNQVLSEVALTTQIDQPVDSLSGGQRKLTLIASELLTGPQLLFLDEPTSGLDPGVETQIMDSLRSLADAGRVVLAVTRSVLALGECDRVLVLAPTGRVAFFGPPVDVLPFLGVDE